MLPFENTSNLLFPSDASRKTLVLPSNECRGKYFLKALPEKQAFLFLRFENETSCRVKLFTLNAKSTNCSVGDNWGRTVEAFGGGTVRNAGIRIDTF